MPRHPLAAVSGRTGLPDDLADVRAAIALAHAGAPAATAALRAAYARCVADEDERGALLAAAALVVTGQATGSFRDFPEWLERLQAMKRVPPPVAAGDEELLGLTGLLCGQLFFDLADAGVDDCVARLVALLEAHTDVNLRLAAARMLLYYVEPRELREFAQRIHSLVLPALADPALTPHRHAHWLLRWRTCAGYAKEPRQEQAATEAARALADAHGLRDIRFALAFDEVSRSLPGGDLPRAERALAEAEALVDPASLRELMLLDVTRMRLAMLKGQADEALFRGSRARRYAVELQAPGPQLGAYVVNEANCRLFAGDHEGARRQMEEALPLLPEGFAREVREMIAMIAAYDGLRAGAPGARAALAAVWAGLRERQFYDTFESQPEFRARLCALALEHDIEVDFVTSLIRKCGLAPPAQAPQAWPWPLRIEALGRFALLRDGMPIATDGKGQRKPLELLQALVAHGAVSAASGMSTGDIIELLWPDLEADAPKASFDMTLMRLRRLVQVDGALRLSEGRLWLDPRVAWCDVAAFEEDCDLLCAAQPGACDLARCTAAARRLRRHRSRKLFGNGAGASWIALPRERLARKFAQAVTGYGRVLEDQGSWLEAIGLYELGIADDALGEGFYRGLMRCHLALGQPAAAVQAFQRCSALLASQIGVPPAAETLALRARIPSA